MLDIIKFHSEKLQTNISSSILYPDDYNNNDKTYKTFFVLSTTNSLINDLELAKIVNNKKIIIVSIYPSLNIKKNSLLFESFKSKYDYSSLYQNFIVNDIIPALSVKYRISEELNERYMIGFDSTALIAFTLPHNYTEVCENIISINLDVTSFEKEFYAYIKSKFMPVMSISLYMKDSKIQKNIEEIYSLFGIVNYNNLKNTKLIDIIKNI